MNAQKLWALICVCLMLIATTPVAAQQSTAPQAAPAPHTYTAAQMLTIWDRLEPKLSAGDLAELEAQNGKSLSATEYLPVFEKLFNKYFPGQKMAEVVPNPAYSDAEELKPVDRGGLYDTWQNRFTKWGTKPISKNPIIDLPDFRSRYREIDEHLVLRPFSEVNPAKAEEMRAEWRRMLQLTKYDWLFAFGIAQIDVLPDVLEEMSYKEHGEHRTWMNVLNDTKGDEAKKRVVIIKLLKTHAIVGHGFGCGGQGFKVKIEEMIPVIKTEVREAKCDVVAASRTEFHSDTESGTYSVKLDPLIEFRGQPTWTLAGKQVATGTSLNLIGSQIPDGESILLFKGFAKIKGEPTDYKEISCQTKLVKIVARCTAISVSFSDGDKKVRLVGDFSDPNSTIAKIQFFVDGKLVGEGKKNELERKVAELRLPPGQHYVTAKAFDRQGNLLAECSGDGKTNVIAVPEPPPPPPPPTVKMSKLYGCTVDPDFSHAEEGYAIFYGRLVDLKTGQTVYGDDQPRVTRLDWVHDRAKKPSRGAKLLHNIIDELSADQRSKFPASVVAVSLHEYGQSGDHVVGMKVTFDQDESVHECWVPWDTPGWTTTEKLVTAGAIIGVAGLIACAIAGCFSGGGVAAIKTVPPGIRPTPPPGIRPPTFNNPF